MDQELALVTVSFLIEQPLDNLVFINLLFLFHCHSFKCTFFAIKDPDLGFVFCEGFTGGALAGTSTQGVAGSISDVNPTQFGSNWNAGTHQHLNL
jgi:hypothetical protein